jgi:hypothetical protein
VEIKTVPETIGRWGRRIGQKAIRESVAARKGIGAGCPDPCQACDGTILADVQDVDYDNVTVRNADGYQGWEEHAPYDGIIVTAAAPHVPQPLVAQLKPGARPVIPAVPVRS